MRRWQQTRRKRGLFTRKKHTTKDQSANLYPLAAEGRLSSTKMGRMVAFHEKAKPARQKVLKIFQLPFAGTTVGFTPVSLHWRQSH